MTVLTVILAPTGMLAGVLDVLRDWSALDVVEPFLWVNADVVGNGDVPALKIAKGTATGTTVQSEVADRHYQTRRICVLVPVFAGAAVASSVVEQRMTGLLESGGSTTRLRLLITRPGAGEGDAVLARLGWHNVLLSPEDSEGPSKMRVTLGPPTSTADVGAHAAAGVAGVAGLFTGADRCPLEGLPLLPGEYLRLARAFYRRVRTEELEGRLRTDVTSISAGVPLPHRPGGCVHIEDLFTQTQSLADNLFARHPGVLRGPRQAPVNAPPVPLGAMAILRMFGAFLLAAIRNAPLQWYRATVASVSSAAARTVHSAVFGQTPVAYTTVVNGMTAQGVPASWSEWGSAAGDLELAAIAASAGPRQRQRADLSGLWNDFAAAAMTLVDAGDRVEGLGPAEFGSSRGVVAGTEQVVPGGASAFDGLPPHLAAAVGFRPVRAEDVLAVDRLRRCLQLAGNDPAVALDATRSEQDLQTWHTRHRSSFAVQVGARIARALTDCQSEIVQLLGRIADAAGSGDEDQDERRRQRALSGRLRLVALITVVATVVVLVAMVAGLLLLPIALIGVLVVVLTGIGVTLTMFVRGQKRLFAEINRRQSAVAQIELDRRNLAEAFADARRIGDAYGEFLAWCSVLSGFLALPYGSAPAGVDAASHATKGFPMSAAIGVAELQPGIMADATARLRRRTFTVGWLSDPWTALLADAGDRVGAEGFDLTADPNLLFKQPGFPTQSLLARWARLVESTGPGAGSGDRLWSVLVDELRADRSDIGESLLGSIASWGATGQRHEQLAWFVADVDRPGTRTGSGFFDDSVLTAQARTAGRAAVDVAICERSPAGLGLVAVLTELGQGLPPYELTFDGTVDPVLATDPAAGPSARPDDSGWLPGEPEQEWVF